MTGDQGGNQEFQSFMATWGAVKVGGRTFFKLMQNGEHVLLFPGGVREVCPSDSTVGRWLAKLCCAWAGHDSCRVR